MNIGETKVSGSIEIRTSSPVRATQALVPGAPLAENITQQLASARNPMRFAGLVLIALLISLSVQAASKPHAVSLGKPIKAKLLIGPSEDKTMDISIRSLYVDGRVKEFTTGSTHDVTDREFVVRRAYRINDTLPDDERQVSKWLWRQGGWLLVNRVSGKIVALKLPDFDPFYSDVSWYRDYAAYCGVSSSGERVIAVVVEIGSSKPLFRKDVGKNSDGDAADSNCSSPHWERQPARVTFLPKVGEKFTVSVSGRFADEAAAERDSDEQ